MHVVTRTSHYTWAENLLFGDEASRKEQLDSLRKQWTPGSTWIFSNMTVKKKQDRFNGCPHGWVLNIGAPGLRAIPLMGDAADAIPSAVEPLVAVKDFTLPWIQDCLF